LSHYIGYILQACDRPQQREAYLVGGIGVYTWRNKLNAGVKLCKATRSKRLAETHALLIGVRLSNVGP